MSDWGETKNGRFVQIGDEHGWDSDNSNDDEYLGETKAGYLDLEEQLWNEATFGAGGIAGDNISLEYPISPCYFAMTSEVQDDDGNYLTLNHHDDIQNTRWARHCEAMASNRQAHGNLFEERVAAYICIEMYNWIVDL